MSSGAPLSSMNAMGRPSAAHPGTFAVNPVFTGKARWPEPSSPATTRLDAVNATRLPSGDSAGEPGLPSIATARRLRPSGERGGGRGVGSRLLSKRIAPVREALASGAVVVGPLDADDGLP